MIYTIGSYLHFMVSGNPQRVEKLGVVPPGTQERPDGYLGGIAFRTRDEARNYLRENRMVEYQVYGLMCDWDNTYHVLGEPFHRIVRNALIVNA